MTDEVLLPTRPARDRWSCWSLSRAPEGRNESEGRRVIVDLSWAERHDEAQTPGRSGAVLGYICRIVMYGLGGKERAVRSGPFEASTAHNLAETIANRCSSSGRVSDYMRVVLVALPSTSSSRVVIGGP